MTMAATATHGFSNLSAAVLAVAGFFLTFATPAAAQLTTSNVYVPLAQPCRIIETRVGPGGTGVKLQPATRYTFGIDDTSIEGANQKGNPTGCGMTPGAVSAISASIYMLNASVSGDVQIWAAGGSTSEPGVAAGVFNPQVPFNNSFANIQVDATGKFNFQVDNASAIDLVIDVNGYWRPISWGGSADGAYSTATGYQTLARGGYSTAMGVQTAAFGAYSTAMGLETIAGSDYSTAMGYSTTAYGMNATAMGAYTTAGGAFSTAMGEITTASGSASTAMGYSTTASGNTSTAMGTSTWARGTGSTAMGVNADASEDYSFVWNGDSAIVHALMSPSAGSFSIYAPGGVYVDAGDFGSGGCTMSNPGSAGWSCSSDRALKTNIEPVDALAVLDQVVGMPVSMWSFKTGPQYRHIGPMAQDFKAAFDLGDTDDKHISTSDAQGVALAAIQGLNAKLEHENAALKSQVAAQASDIEELKAAVKLLQRERAPIERTEESH